MQTAIVLWQGIFKAMYVTCCSLREQARSHRRLAVGTVSVEFILSTQP